MTNIGNYYMNRSGNVTIIKNTTIINNYGTENNRRYTMGPNAVDVQRYTGRSIQPMRVTNVSDNNSAGVGNNELRVYRPITRTDNTSPNNRATATPPDNNRTVAPSTRTQPAQQPTNSRGATTPTQQTRSAQPATQQSMNQSSYRPDPAQPKVKNTAAPQTSKQIQAAQNENKKVQQQRSATTTRTNTDVRPRR